jgi:hypothetical protein
MASFMCRIMPGLSPGIAGHCTAEVQASFIGVKLAESGDRFEDGIDHSARPSKLRTFPIAPACFSQGPLFRSLHEGLIGEPLEFSPCFWPDAADASAKDGGQRGRHKAHIQKRYQGFGVWLTESSAIRTPTLRATKSLAEPSRCGAQNATAIHRNHSRAAPDRT